ncbi:MAG: triose-phosphate isomerase [Oleiphilaceae bacterium]|nr:triose-phosphate isomerase [Oleiphilaceae bacterium]
MRRKIVAGNWKMNGSSELVTKLIGGVKSELSAVDKGVEVVIIPPALYLRDVQQEAGDSGLKLGVQNVSQYESGAYTGEISPAMVADVGAEFALIGHSERRALFSETDETIAAKVQCALTHKLTALLCVGETLDERDAGQAETVVCGQVERALAGVSGDSWKQVVIAYEPVWAIGTGKTATADDAQQMHKTIRSLLEKLDAPADTISLLYGGSVKADNAAQMFSQPDIDGGLIGGASLKADDFARIFKAI